MGERKFRVGKLDSTERCNSAWLFYGEDLFLQFGQKMGYAENGSPPVHFNLWFFSRQNLPDITFPSFEFLKNIRDAGVVDFRQALERAGQLEGTIYENSSLAPNAKILRAGDTYRSYPFNPAECQAIILDSENYSILLDNNHANMVLHGWEHYKIKTRVKMDAFDPAISESLTHYLMDVSAVRIPEEKTSELKNSLDELLSYFNPVISE